MKKLMEEIEKLQKEGKQEEAQATREELQERLKDMLCVSMLGL